MSPHLPLHEQRDIASGSAIALEERSIERTAVFLVESSLYMVKALRLHTYIGFSPGLKVLARIMANYNMDRELVIDC